MRTTVCTLTERGQVSVPAGIRRIMGLEPGQELVWEAVSTHECRVLVGRRHHPKGPRAMLGSAKPLARGRKRNTAQWLEVLRAGER